MVVVAVVLAVTVGADIAGRIAYGFGWALGNTLDVVGWAVSRLPSVEQTSDPAEYLQDVLDSPLRVFKLFSWSDQFSV